MTGSVFPLIANIFIALLIAAAFLVFSRTKAALPSVRWFGVSYAIGAATPASELLVHLSPTPGVFVAASYATFCLAFHVMAHGLARYYRYALPTSLLALTFGLSLLTRAAIWNGPRNTLPYELYYQAPFSAIMLICAFVLFRASRRRWLDASLACVFVITAVHFLVKPFVAVVLGSGNSATDYVNSRYALFSQATTGMLLIAIALCLLLVVARDTIESAHRDADTDVLSGLFNRRAFDREATAALSRMEKERRPCVAVVFDLDHFKQINDTYGHSAGDLIIQEFSSLLRGAARSHFVVGRTGGEEFSILLPGCAAREALQWAENVRGLLAERAFRSQDREYRMTVSCGAAAAQPGEDLPALMRRSDLALYAAKNRGRNRVVPAES